MNDVVSQSFIGICNCSHSLVWIKHGRNRISVVCFFSAVYVRFALTSCVWSPEQEVRDNPYNLELAVAPFLVDRGTVWISFRFLMMSASLLERCCYVTTVKNYAISCTEREWKSLYWRHTGEFNKVIMTRFWQDGLRLIQLCVSFGNQYQHMCQNQVVLIIATLRIRCYGCDRLKRKNECQFTDKQTDGK